MKIRLTKASTAALHGGITNRKIHHEYREFWAQTEELMCDPAEIEPVVAELVRLAQIAASSTKGLSLWGSL